MKPTNPDPRRTPPAHDSHPHDRHHAAHGHTAQDGAHNEDVAHEYTDVNVRALLIFCFGLIAICAAVAVAMWGLFGVFETQAVQNDPILSPLARPAGQLPPEPRLLSDEPLNLQIVKAREREVLEGYGWVDQQNGVTRIPIEEAKRRLLQQGLPVRPDAPTDPWVGNWTAAGGDSSSGRAIPIRPGVLGPVQPEVPAAGQPPGRPAPPVVPRKGGGQ